MYWLKLLDDETYKHIYNYVKDDTHNVIKQLLMKVENENKYCYHVRTSYMYDGIEKHYAIKKDDQSLLSRCNVLCGTRVKRLQYDTKDILNKQN